jgi:hypothetical protein
MSYPKLIHSKIKDITWLCPRQKEDGMLLLENETSSLSPFSEEVLSFLNDLSQLLRDHPKKRTYPEIAAFSFFCRRSNLIQLREPYEYELGTRLGRGRVFHITPSNVPMNFAYSLVAALLAGNSNIVRISTKKGEQVEIVLKAINELLEHEEHLFLKSYIQIVQYAREYKEITNILSELCDVRVIWGGNESIKEIRKAPLPAHAYDITFADRTSLAVINTDNLNTYEHLAQSFYNDTYVNDQNACTSPFLVVWVGKENHTIKELFWNRLEEIAQENYALNQISGVDKLSTFMQHSVDTGGNLTVSYATNILWKIQIEEYSPKIERFRCNSGYFIEIDVEHLFDLLPQLSRNYQTLSYHGFQKEELLQILRVSKTQGIDRIVPIGRTQEFSLVWDGFDLIRSMSRQIS